MQKREKVLLACVVGLLGVVGLFYLYGLMADSFDQRDQQISALESEIRGKQLQVLKGKKSAQRLAEYNARSLPSETALARSLYQNWLIGLIDKIGLACGITSQEPQVQRNSYSRLSFTISGQGTLPQIVQLLHAFYSSGYLHQVRLLNIERLEDGKFELLFAVEALSLPDATERERLPKAKPQVVLADLAEYQTTFMQRNIFAPYTAPEAVQVAEVQPRPAPKPTFDAAKFTTVSAILHFKGQPQVWLNNRTTGEVLRLGVGSAFEVGNIRGTIERIGLRDVDVLADGRRWTLALGANLRDATTPN